jgi:hypothetical protein
VFPAFHCFYRLAGMKEGLRDYYQRIKIGSADIFERRISVAFLEFILKRLPCRPFCDPLRLSVTKGDPVD